MDGKRKDRKSNVTAPKALQDKGQSLSSFDRKSGAAASLCDEFKACLCQQHGHVTLNRLIVAQKAQHRLHSYH